MKVILMVAVALIVTSCATPHTVMVNEKGETMRCASTGVGLYHAVAAQETYKGCVADAKKLGFHEMQ